MTCTLTMTGTQMKTPSSCTVIVQLVSRETRVVSRVAPMENISACKCVTVVLPSASLFRSLIRSCIAKTRNGGECVFTSNGDFDLYCDCSNAVDDDGTRYGESRLIGRVTTLFLPVFCRTRALTHCLNVLVGRWCENQEEEEFQCGDGFSFCLNGGKCNELYP